MRDVESGARPVGRGGTRGVVGIGVLLVLLGGAVVAAGIVLIVWTHLGQRADERSRWSVAVPDAMTELLLTWLGTVSIGFVAAGLLACVVLALLSGRVSRALGAVLLVAGANVTTQVLKMVIPRPTYGIGYDNSLPSGHTTVMTSLFLAAILVLPRGLRPLAVAAGAAASTFTGAATIIERWHRPSDVIAALGVCGIWAGVTLLVVAAVQRPRTPAARRPSGPGWGRFALDLACGLFGAAAVGVVLLTGGLVSHGEASNVVIGGVMLSVFGVGAALLTSLTAAGADALGRAGDGREPAADRPVG